MAKDIIEGLETLVRSAAQERAVGMQAYIKDVEGELIQKLDSCFCDGGGSRPECAECVAGRDALVRCKELSETWKIQECMNSDEFTLLVQALKQHPQYRRAVARSRDLSDVEERLEIATRTKHPSYIRVAREAIEEFRSKWMRE